MQGQQQVSERRKEDVSFRGMRKEQKGLKGEKPPGTWIAFLKFFRQSSSLEKEKTDFSVFKIGAVVAALMTSPRMRSSVPRRPPPSWVRAKGTADVISLLRACAERPGDAAVAVRGTAKPSKASNPGKSLQGPRNRRA